MAENEDDLKMMEELARPFDPEKLSFRAGATNKKQKGGTPDRCQALAYLDARDVMQRLDEVVGKIRWHSRMNVSDSTVVCQLTIELPSGVVVTRTDGAGHREAGGGLSKGDSIKGACSDALKRAAVQLGVGQYLYDIEGSWVSCNGRGQITPEGKKQLLREYRALADGKPQRKKGEAAPAETAKNDPMPEGWIKQLDEWNERAVKATGEEREDAGWIYVLEHLELAGVTALRIHHYEKCQALFKKYVEEHRQEGAVDAP